MSTAGGDSMDGLLCFVFFFSDNNDFGWIVGEDESWWRATWQLARKFVPTKVFALDEGQNHYSLTKIFQIREKVWKDKSK